MRPIAEGADVSEMEATICSLLSWPACIRQDLSLPCHVASLWQLISGACLESTSLGAGQVVPGSSCSMYADSTVGFVGMMPHMHLPHSIRCKRCVHLHVCPLLCASVCCRRCSWRCL